MNTVVHHGRWVRRNRPERRRWNDAVWQFRNLHAYHTTYVVADGVAFLSSPWASGRRETAQAVSAGRVYCPRCSEGMTLSGTQTLSEVIDYHNRAMHPRRSRAA